MAGEDINALAIFQDGDAHWASFFLKQGFRHVMVAVDDGRAWVVIDPDQGVPRVEVIGESGYDLETFYRSCGCTVIPYRVRQKPLKSPFALANCVGFVKAMLGIRAPLVWTPYQLYRHMRKA
jgi:hypothetical protein